MEKRTILETIEFIKSSNSSLQSSYELSDEYLRGKRRDNFGDYLALRQRQKRRSFFVPEVTKIVDKKCDIATKIVLNGRLFRVENGENSTDLGKSS